MADWERRANYVSGDVIFFEYVTSKLVRDSDVVYVWDIDKTYLDTHFDDVKGLIRTALEKAFQKKNVPGTSSLVRALTGTFRDGGGTKPFPIYFISASPPQLERRIRSKLEIDGVKPYGSFFKDNLRNLRPKYFNRLKRQVGYKLQALLELRTRLRGDVQQILWGDDSESDAIIYSLYSDICARRLKSEECDDILDRLSVLRPQRERIVDLQNSVPEQDPVERVYINLANDTDPDYYMKFGRRILATFNTFQASLDLYQNNRLSSDQLLRVGQDMLVNYGFTPEQLSWSFEDLVRRRLMKRRVVEEVSPLLQKNQIIPAKFRFSQRRLEDLETAESTLPPWIPDSVDYLNDFR